MSAENPLTSIPSRRELRAERKAARKAARIFDDVGNIINEGAYRRASEETAPQGPDLYATGPKLNKIDALQAAIDRRTEDTQIHPLDTDLYESESPMHQPGETWKEEADRLRYKKGTD